MWLIFFAMIILDKNKLKIFRKINNPVFQRLDFMLNAEQELRIKKVRGNIKELEVNYIYLNG